MSDEEEATVTLPVDALDILRFLDTTTSATDEEMDDEERSGNEVVMAAMTLDQARAIRRIVRHFDEKTACGNK